MAQMRNRYLYITLLTMLGFSAEATAQVLQNAPQLVVNITVNQLRTDLLETYVPFYTQNGLKRLMEQGMMFPYAHYDFTPVDAVSASASLQTGTTPYYHGVTGTEWLNRTTLRPQHILDEQGQKLSPSQLMTSTLGDELKIATKGQGKVLSFATSAACAILSAGHAADGAVWIEKGKWQQSPYYKPANQWLSWYVNQYLPTNDNNRSITDLVIKSVEQLGLGNDDQPDLLCVNYDLQPDMVGYQLMDRNIAALVKGILGRIPQERVLFVLTGATTTEEEQESENERYHIPTGKVYINRSANLLNMYLGAMYGSAQYVETYYKNQIFLNKKVIEQKNLKRTEVLQLAQDFLSQLSGICQVYTSHQLQTSDSEALRLIRNGYHKEKCGDLIVEVNPGWQLVNEETHQQTTSRANVIPFPIILFGSNIQAQRVQTAVTAERVAPTIARAIRIRAPNACKTEPLF
jgi:hypothetical protein